MQKYLVILSACVLAICCAASVIRVKREAFQLPDGVQAYIPPIKPNFKCQTSGYFADVENKCKLFHVCVAQENHGKNNVMQYTFACGNQTIFNQFSMTCAHEAESIPCEASKEFFYLNDRIGKEKVLLHTEQDIEKLTSTLSLQE